MIKAELRKLYLEKRKTLSNDEVLILSKKILENFILQFNIIENQNVHVFLPIKKFNEIETKFCVEYFWKRKVNVFVPKIFQNKIISVKLTPETILKENSWRILEPISNENECSNSVSYTHLDVYKRQLNMRARASMNFTIEDLPEISRRCKEKGVRTYRTLNSIRYDHDLSIIKTRRDKAKEADLTAVIAMDQAVIAYARQIGMEGHISTQINITNIETVKF